MPLLPHRSPFRSPSRRARWAVPAGTAAVVAAGLLVSPVVADASPGLPTRSAAELLASTRAAADHPFSGTVTQTARLGLPELPGAGSTSLSLASLVTGTHTARVWYAAPDRSRVALVGNLAETDVVRSGNQVWTWSSEDRKASRTILPAEARGDDAREKAPDATSITPTQAAQKVLAAIDPTTRVSVDGTASVAGRSAYELVLAPRDTRSLVGQVRLAVDAKNGTPLRVEVFARGASTPAFETGFTSISFAKPDASVFRFTPPAGAKVTTRTLSAPKGHDEHSHGKHGDLRSLPAGDRPEVLGSGWTAVVTVPGVKLGSGATNEQLSTVLRSADRVTGAFGSGRILRTALVTALLTDQGRLYVGSVTPAVLEQAAASASAGSTSAG